MATDTDGEVVPSESDTGSESSPTPLLTLEPEPYDVRQHAVNVGTAKRTKGTHEASLKKNKKVGGDDDEEAEEEGDEDSVNEDDEDDEPRLKYTYLTSHLGGIYRKGDATSAFSAGGDKMVS